MLKREWTFLQREHMCSFRQRKAYHARFSRKERYPFFRIANQPEMRKIVVTERGRHEYSVHD